ncbi:molecular chaperone TorD [Defluviimonas sp. 20V17]|uniref:Chaperone TorD involved in molybdoenzyme TorA maturation n=1 Tax=Allgaiera indica TaxID=765699 RepID=A0AAN4ZZM3_9RHOB|nr:molecular chaperone TorD family protein [Allgaiera indica]KDB01737.1 molecular chaperone TorD [Defluviimonas sp. 20V17]GHE02490.1 molecular chaperone TorD [Allgaiera indica]SDX29102.1 chaperone TorD involved in molybdoenzyme TorA maturation [Allgaiera indica]
MTQFAAVQPKTDEADQLRADLYRVLARLFSGPLDAASLAGVAGLQGDGSDLGQAINALAAQARDTTPEAAAEEFQQLFIGVSRGLLLPYGSYYLTGFLHEKPLARLRTDMAPLGITRRAGVVEPEDHIAALMEMMAGLIEGDFGAPQPLSVQSDFFTRHIGTWAEHFFTDLENLPQARLYAPAGRAGRLFMAVEAQAFEM